MRWLRTVSKQVYLFVCCLFSFSIEKTRRIAVPFKSKPRRNYFTWKVLFSLQLMVTSFVTFRFVRNFIFCFIFGFSDEIVKPRCNFNYTLMEALACAPLFDSNANLHRFCNRRTGNYCNSLCNQNLNKQFIGILMRAGIDPADNPSPGVMQIFCSRTCYRGNWSYKKIEEHSSGLSSMFLLLCRASRLSETFFFKIRGLNVNNKILLKSKTELFAFNYKR